MELLGLTFAPFDDAARSTYNYDQEANGVLIAEVDEGSIAYEKGVRAGNLVIEIGQETVTSPSGVEARIKALKDDGRKNALLLIADAAGDLQFVVLRIE